METYVGQFAGLPLYADPEIPEGLVRLMDKDGNTVAWVKIDRRASE